MLADSQYPAEGLGSLGKEVKLPKTFLQELITFIASELPIWRDRPDRKRESSETSLSAQLCAHLNSAARHTKGLDILQFRQEEPDDHTKSRRIDLVAAPNDTTICVDGRRHVDFDTLLPIECKRLPTPNDPDRDEREYVFSRHSSTGGIQRFKAGHHGAGHALAAMIGYVQQETCDVWNVRIGEWINSLIASKQEGWSDKDLLQLENLDSTRRTAALRSFHTRLNGNMNIELRHLWVQLNLDN